MNSEERTLAPVRVLVMGMTNKVGGLETFVMRYCERMHADRVRFDFLSRFDDCVFADRIQAIGGRLYTVTRRSHNPVRYYQQIRAFFREHGREYDIIWDHECSASDITPLAYAKRAGIAHRLFHNHTAENMDISLMGCFRAFLHGINRRRIRRYATDLYACGEAAARWIAPDAPQSVRIIHNALDTDAFRFSPERREAVRRAEGWEGRFIVGNTARLQYPKNQAFLLDVFAALREQAHNTLLVIAGDGPDASMLHEKARALGLGEDRVRFLGHRTDVAALLQGMDAFALSSYVEGVSIAALEAQAAGLPCLLSEDMDSEVDITGLVRFLPSDETEAWVRAIEAQRVQTVERQTQDRAFKDAGYTLDAAVAKREAAFVSMVQDGVRYVLSVPRTLSFANALTKAREDVEALAFAEGFSPFMMRSVDSAHGNLLAQVGLVFRCAADWSRLARAVQPRDTILVQYPHFPLKSAPLVKRSMQRIQKKIGVRFVALVHDLDTLRGIGGQAARYSDDQVLPLFDVVVCHNPAMAEYLAGQGIPQERLVSLGCFDYLTDVPMPARTQSDEVCVAGNLAREKCGYLYKLLEGDSLPYALHLYGADYTGPPGEAVWHGIVMAQELPGCLQGAFGLVWDGDSLDGCTGPYGEYLRYNNPHKLSLYLAAGLPVILWRDAAQAAFVMGQSAGVAVSSLTELPKVLDNLTAEEYAVIHKNASELGKKVRNGHFFSEAMKVVKRLAQ